MLCSFGSEAEYAIKTGVVVLLSFHHKNAQLQELVQLKRLLTAILCLYCQ